MNNRLADFRHAPGNHCATTAISLLLAHHGHAISEAMCLGLGAGLDFFYVVDESLSPTRIVMGRMGDLEVDCFRRLGVPVAVRTTADDALAWRWVRDEIDAGRPAMIQVDIRWLDYYRTKTHFGGHKVLVVGYDERAQTATISDNEFPDLQTLPLASLARARTHTAPPWILQNNFYDVRIPPALTPLEQAAPAAIAACSARLSADRGPTVGLAGMARAAAEMESWAQAPDWSWSARFAYQVIEKRGTGGGAFRTMYAAFLDQARPYCADIERLELAPRMREVAAAWTALALCLRDVSANDEPRGFDEAARRMRIVYERERDYHFAARECRCATADGG
ncbi:MAG TPA: BtrH N-terminal domain-containing protein [bacterium]|nr:BtrH N-terminal domain-containing protein [bacterium]